MDLLPDSPLTIALSVVAVFVGVFYWYLTNTYDYWKNKGVLYEPPKFPFGNIADAFLMRRNFNEIHEELYKKYEGHPYVGIYNMKMPALLIRDPELIKSILVKDFQNFHDRGMVIHEKHPLQQHLFNLPGYRWRILRNKLSPTFTSGKMKGMFSIMEECSKNMITMLKKQANKGDIVEMKNILANFSTDVIGTCAFGLQMNAMNDPNSEFRQIGRKVFDPSIITKMALVVNTFIPDLARILKMDDLGRGVTGFFLRVVKETMDYRVKNKIKRNDFFQLLMNIKLQGKVDDGEESEKDGNGVQENGKDGVDFEFDDGLMTAQAFVFFLAGFETSSTTMSFALHELAVNQDIQAKLRGEVDAALEENNGKFTYDSIMNMPYLDKVVSESLRLYPPVFFLVREVTSPYTVPGTKLQLEKGISVVIPAFALQRDPKHFPDPLRFDPERFSEEQKATRHHYSYLPFGEGPRNCIGMRFGLLQTKLGLAALVSKYEFHLCDRTEIPIRFDPKTVVTSSMTGTIVRIANRS